MVYTLSFNTPAGFTWTVPTTGNPISDSNVSKSGTTAPMVLGSGESNLTIDAGVVSTLKISKRGVGSGINGAIGKDKLITY